MSSWPETVGAAASVAAVLGMLGRAALRPLGARLGRIEAQTEGTAAELPKLGTSLAELGVTAKANAERIEHLEDRITDHRRRNDQQAELLREALARRNEIVDKRLDRLQVELLRSHPPTEGRP